MSLDITSGSSERSLLPYKTQGSVVSNNLGKAIRRTNNDDQRTIFSTQLTELDNCFQEEQYEIMRAAAAFLPQSKSTAHAHDGAPVHKARSIKTVRQVWRGGT